MTIAESGKTSPSAPESSVTGSVTDETSPGKYDVEESPGNYGDEESPRGNPDDGKRSELVLDLILQDDDDLVFVDPIPHGSSNCTPNSQASRSPSSLLDSMSRSTSSSSARSQDKCDYAADEAQETGNSHDGSKRNLFPHDDKRDTSLLASGRKDSRYASSKHGGRRKRKRSRNGSDRKRRRREHTKSGRLSMDHRDGSRRHSSHKRHGESPSERHGRRHRDSRGSRGGSDKKSRSYHEKHGRTYHSSRHMKTEESSGSGSSKRRKSLHSH